MLLVPPLAPTGLPPHTHVHCLSQQRRYQVCITTGDCDKLGYLTSDYKDSIIGHHCYSFVFQLPFLAASAIYIRAMCLLGMYVASECRLLQHHMMCCVGGFTHESSVSGMNTHTLCDWLDQSHAVYTCADM